MTKDESLEASALAAYEKAGTPDYIFMSEKAYWCLKYDLGLCRYKPRMPGKRIRRRRFLEKQQNERR